MLCGQALTRAESQWKNRTMRSGEMSKEEAQFWRLQRYAYTWPPPWLAQMQNQSNPVVFLDVAVHALDRSVRLERMPHVTPAENSLFCSMRVYTLLRVAEGKRNACVQAGQS